MTEQSVISEVRIANAKDKTAVEIQEEMDSIWLDFRKKKLKTQEERDSYYERARGDHKDLNMAYPTVLRHMLQEGYYSSSAFEKYLKKLAVKPWTNDATRMDSYSDYWVLLYRQTHKHYNMAALQRMRAEYREMLQEEHDNFQKAYKKYEQEFEAKEIANQLRKKQELLEAFQRLSGEKGLNSDYVNKIVQLYDTGKLPVESMEQLCAMLLNTRIEPEKTSADSVDEDKTIEESDSSNDEKPKFTSKPTVTLF